MAEYARTEIFSMSWIRTHRVHEVYASVYPTPAGIHIRASALYVLPSSRAKLGKGPLWFPGVFKDLHGKTVL